ncbi:MAG: hypothetical protein ABFS45_19315 [Pseudomonadota bacterium]
MANTHKEIEALRARIQKLEQQQEKENKEREALEGAHQHMMQVLEEAGLSFETFVRFNYKTIRRIVSKIDKEEVKKEQPVKTPAKKKVSVKRRRKAARAKTTVKIPAGKYTNVPSEPDTVFEVKDKGPRPKVLKAYAEEVGLNDFFEQCRVD